MIMQLHPRIEPATVALKQSDRLLKLSGLIKGNSQTDIGLLKTQAYLWREGCIRTDLKSQPDKWGQTPGQTPALTPWFTPCFYPHFSWEDPAHLFT